MSFYVFLRKIILLWIKAYIYKKDINYKIIIDILE